MKTRHVDSHTANTLRMPAQSSPLPAELSPLLVEPMQSPPESAQLLAETQRTLFDYAPDGILIANAEGYYLDANPSMCRMLGLSREEIVGRNALDIVAPPEFQHIAPALQEIASDRDYQRHWLFKRRDGSLFETEVTATKLANGNVLAMVRDISERRQREHEIARLSHLYSALSQINHALVWGSSRDELLQKICRVLIEQGCFKLAWIGWFDPHSHQIHSVADYGDDEGYVRNIKIYADDRADIGPTGLALRTGKAYICNDVRHNPITLPWRDQLLQRGYRALAAFPIREKGAVAGTLTVLSDKENFFANKEIMLLEEAVANISFGLDNLTRERERTQAQALADSEKHFSDTMIESMPGILYFYNSQGQFLRWNRNFETVSGYSGAEIATMHPLDFFSAEEKNIVDEKISEVFATGDSSVEALFVAKDLSRTPYFFTGRKVFFKGELCLVGMGIDITGPKLAELKLSESEQKYRELVEHANSIILRWNGAGKITFLNEFGQRYFGYTADEIIGRHVIGTIVPSEDSDGHDLQSLMQQICENPAAFEQNVNQNVRRNGERVWIAWTNKLVCDEHGEIIEILSIGSDITDQRRAEDTIRELNANLEQRVFERTEALNAALIRAEAADKIKSAFLATMSHELRTPLNSIIGFTGILLQHLAGPLNDEQSKQLGMVRGSARHLLELINDVLDLSKIEAGQLEMKAEPFDLRESIERAINLVQPLADKKALSLSHMIADGIGLVVGDRRRCEQILINLLNNSIKFTERGGVALNVESIVLSGAGGSQKPAIRIAIKDTGIGIKSEHIGVLFQAFQQVDSGLARQHEGTGLGLAICRRLTQLMGGDISVRSEWSKGSEFIVTLPLLADGGKS
jgi:PAS domain S-box-containing protein